MFMDAYYYSAIATDLKDCLDGFRNIRRKLSNLSVQLKDVSPESVHKVESLIARIEDSERVIDEMLTDVFIKDRLRAVNEYLREINQFGGIEKREGSGNVLLGVLFRRCRLWNLRGGFSSYHSARRRRSW